MGGSGDASCTKVIVTRRLAATNGSSGNSGWVSARPATMKKLAAGNTPGISTFGNLVLAEQD